MVKIWMLLTEKKIRLTTVEILSMIDPDLDKINYVRKVSTKSGKYKSCYRTLTTMANHGTISRWPDPRKAGYTVGAETLWSMNALTPSLDYLKKKYFSNPPPYGGICGKGCWFAKNVDCVCKCGGVYHGKGRKQKDVKT